MDRSEKFNKLHIDQRCLKNVIFEKINKSFTSQKQRGKSTLEKERGEYLRELIGKPLPWQLKRAQ